jgi:hypothetical protein
MQMLSPVADRERAQREFATLAKATLDEHWAVAAVASDRRALLVERAEVAALTPGDGLGEPISDGLALLGTAYELAALGHLDAALSPTAGSGRDLAQAVLALGAGRSFRCSASLRIPADDPESTVRWALRLGAQAAVAGQTDAFTVWWQQRSGLAETVKRFAQELESQPWESYSRGTLWLAWLGILGAPMAAHWVAPAGSKVGRDAAISTQPLAATRSRLAAFRERRAVHEAPVDSALLNAAALRARMSEFAVRHLADATELLTVAVLRRTLPDVTAEFKLHLSAARSAMAGDHGHDLLLAWLQAAGVTLAGGVTAQLELPGF